MVAAILIIFLTLVFSYFLSKKDTPRKIFNVYAQPGKWYYLKFIIFITVLGLSRLRAKLKGPLLVKKLEKMKGLSNHEKAFDAVFFHFIQQTGIYMCGGIERRHNAKANALFYIAVPELGLLETPKLPNTLVDSDPASVLLLKEYGAVGISLEPVVPMKKWHVSYNGKMRLQRNPDMLVDVHLKGEWTSDLPYFLFENDMNLKCLAKAIARETWDRDFFQALKSAHQTHYEQMGYFKGTLVINQKTYRLDMDAFRDHSFGHKRDWTLMHRYIFHMLYLEDGTRVSFGVVSQPVTTSVLELGYVVLPNKSIHSIESTDLVLYQHGENGNPGKNYAFSFRANQRTYEAKIRVIYESFHYKGNDVEAKLIERFINCEVNGIKGKGVSEWHYNNLSKRK